MRQVPSRSQSISAHSFWQSNSNWEQFSRHCAVHECPVERPQQKKPPPPPPPPPPPAGSVGAGVRSLSTERAARSRTRNCLAFLPSLARMAAIIPRCISPTAARNSCPGRRSAERQIASTSHGGAAVVQGISMPHARMPLPAACCSSACCRASQGANPTLSHRC